MMKHKIIMDNQVLDILEDTLLEIKDTKSVTINILKDLNLYVLNLLNKKDINITFNIFANANIYNYYDECKTNSNININMFENVKLNYFSPIISTGESKHNINTFHKYKKTTCNINLRGLTLKNASLILNVSSYVDKEAIDTVIHQNNRIINTENGMGEINPNLYIDCDKVEASHAAYIGGINKSEVFYLKSRGLNEVETFNIMLRGYLLGNIKMDMIIKDKLLQLIDKYRR